MSPPITLYIRLGILVLKKWGQQVWCPHAVLALVARYSTMSSSLSSRKGEPVVSSRGQHTCMRTSEDCVISDLCFSNEAIPSTFHDITHCFKSASSKMTGWPRPQGQQYIVLVLVLTALKVLVLKDQWTVLVPNLLYMILKISQVSGSWLISTDQLP